MVTRRRIRNCSKRRIGKNTVAASTQAARIAWRIADTNRRRSCERWARSKKPSGRRLARPETVFLTGASGFVGSHVAERLLEAGYRLRALNRGAAALPAGCESVTG